MFQVEENKTVYKVDDKIMGEVDYPHIDDKTVNITHTFVDPSLRGQGIADQMLKKAFEYFEENNIEVKCTCSYAKNWVEHHKEKLCQKKKMS